MKKNTFNNKKKTLKINKKFIIRLFLLFFIILIFFVIGTITAIAINIRKIPDIEQLEKYHPPESTEILTENGKLIAKLFQEENRKIVKINEISPYLQKAVICAEDLEFWQHKGISLLGLTRAVFFSILRKRIIGGGSTITQQLVKNLFLTPEMSISRKIIEAYLAYLIEKKYKKEQILEFYLNQIYWGHNAYGIEIAAGNYFGKKASQLNLAESAILAGIIRAPEVFSPYKNFKGARIVQSIVLKSMLKHGYISEKEKKEAESTPIKLAGLKTHYKYPYFLDYVLFKLREKYNEAQLRQAGLKIYVTIDPTSQEFAENLIKREISKLVRYNIHQGALISIDPNTGYIKSMVGGVDYKKSQFNRVFQAYRQIGSTFKPIVYLTAFNKGYSPDSIENDGPIKFGNWSPKNYDRSYRGNITLRRALEQSINVVTVKIADKVGIQEVINTAKSLGIKSEIKPYLTSALGASEMTPLEVASIYGVFATGGLRVEPTPIIKIVDRNNNIIEQYIPNPIRVYDEAPIFTLTGVLQGVITRGTGMAANIGRPAAGKTGTTSNYIDAWFVGYIPQLVTVVWVGNDNPSPMIGGTGGGICAPIWAKYMKYVTRNMPVQNFIKKNTMLILTSITPSVEISNIPSQQSTPVVETPMAETPLPIFESTSPPESNPTPTESDIIEPEIQTTPDIQEIPAPLSESENNN